MYVRAPNPGSFLIQIFALKFYGLMEKAIMTNQLIFN